MYTTALNDAAAKPSGNATTRQPGSASGTSSCGSPNTSIENQMIRAEPIRRLSRPAPETRRRERGWPEAGRLEAGPSVWGLPGWGRLAWGLLVWGLLVWGLLEAGRPEAGPLVWWHGARLPSP
ncbi:MAG: hypothetical protein JO345_06610 [Streptosporangiaceae bacterium]|nr:hypothetical protein [Streptosporangiaceae bacterium]